MLTDRDEMSNPYREPSIYAFYQVSVQLAMRFQRIFFRNQPIKNRNCLWRPCLLTNRDKMSNLYRGPSIDVFYQVSIYLPSSFKGEYFQNSANQKQELPVVAMFVNGSGRNG
jgi:hypothetical protein